MFKEGQTVLVTRDWEDNNTRGKLGIILKIDGSDYKIGFLKELNKSNSDTYWFTDKYPDIKPTWWVRSYLIKSSVTKNKFK